MTELILRSDMLAGIQKIILELHLTLSSKMFQALRLTIPLLEMSLIMKFQVIMEMTNFTVVPVMMFLIGLWIVEVEPT